MLFGGGGGGGGKRLGREADHSPPSSTEDKNALSYTSTPRTLMSTGVHRTDFTFLYLHKINWQENGTIFWALLLFCAILVARSSPLNFPVHNKKPIYSIKVTTVTVLLAFPLQGRYWTFLYIVIQSPLMAKWAVETDLQIMLKFVGGGSMLRHLVLINASESTARTHCGGRFESTAFSAT